MPREVTIHDCRFCGSDDVWFTQIPPVDTFASLRLNTAITCSSCGARGPSLADPVDAALAWNWGVELRNVGPLGTAQWRPKDEPAGTPPAP